MRVIYSYTMYCEERKALCDKDRWKERRKIMTVKPGA